MPRTHTTRATGGKLIVQTAIRRRDKTASCISLKYHNFMMEMIYD